MCRWKADQIDYSGRLRSNDYATNDGRILSEEITYCDDFADRYEDFIRRTQMFNPDMSAEDISSKEDYYWTVYKA